MLKIPVAAHTAGISRRSILYAPTIAEGATSVTLTIPGAGLPWYHVTVATNWQHNGWYVVSQTETQVVIGFGTPAGPSPWVQIEIIY